MASKCDNCQYFDSDRKNCIALVYNIGECIFELPVNETDLNEIKEVKRTCDAEG